MAYKTKEQFLTWNDKKPVLLSEDDFYAPDLSSQDYLELISELIRLDVPILEIGSSSIGKSFSIREMLEASGIKGEFLFVGTEKAEFIEGIPNLKATEKRTEKLKTQSGATKAEITEEVGEKFTYLKPYWFPNKVEIANRLGSGRNQLDKIASLVSDANGTRMAEMWSYVQGKGGSAFKGQNAFGVLETLKVMLLDYKKSEAEIKREKMAEKESGKKSDYSSQYIYADALQYISMVQGYGNFWLILDEIDKVSEPDKDKYAPLLHIVRERELKGWKLSGIRSYPEYDPKFVADISLRVEKLNKALDLVAQGTDIDLTDTRIIAIANDLRTLEKASPALYRRFVKMIIEKTLYIEKKKDGMAATTEEQERKKIELEMKDPAKAYNSTRFDFNNCIVSKPIQKEVTLGGKEVSSLTVGEDMARIDQRLVGKPLDELNLQWTLGFFPEILFPGQAIDPITDPLSIPNKIIENFNNENEVYKMWYYKILRDNFETKYIQPLMVCANQLVGKKKITTESRELRSEMDADEILSAVKDFDNPDKEVVINDVIERYKKILGFSSEAFQKIIEEQKGKQGLSGVQDTTNTVYNTGKQKIVTGSRMIEKSFKDGKPTQLTNLLMSSIPFVQQSFLAHNPYISTDVSRQFQDDIDDSMKSVIEKLGGDISSSAALQNATDKLQLDEELVNMYGFGISLDMYGKVKTASPAMTDDAVAAKQEILNQIIENKPVMIFDGLARKLSPKQKYEYVSNSSMWLLAEKEVLQNISEILIYYTLDYPANSTDASLEMTYYATRFPYSVKTFIDNIDSYKGIPELMNDDKQPLFDIMRTVVDESIANSTYSKLDLINA